MGARKTLSASGVRATVGVGVRVGVGVGVQVAVSVGRTAGAAVAVGQGGVRMAAGMVAVVGSLEVFEQPVTLNPKVSHKILDIIQPKVASLPFTLSKYRLWGKRKERTTG
jgi:hypothetical protein